MKGCLGAGKECVWAYLRDSGDLVPDHHNKISITIKQAVIFLLVEGLAVDLFFKKP